MATNKSSFDFKTTLKDSFDAMKAIFVKPASKGAEKLSKFDDLKSAGVLAAFIVIISTIINLLTTMASAIVTRTYSLTSGAIKTKIDWGNLNNVDYFKAIWQGLLYGAIAIAAIAGIIYIVALVMKKTTNYAKLLSIVAVSYVPALVVSLIGAIVSTFAPEVGLIITTAGTIYSGAIIISSVNKEVSLDGDKNIYFHSIVIVIIYIIAYIVLTNILKTSLLGGLSSFGL